MFPLVLNRELDLLGWRLVEGGLAYADYRQEVASLLLRHFNCSRVAVWRLSTADGSRRLDCLDAYSAAGVRTSDEDALPESRLGAYFQELVQHGAYVCDDTHIDPNLDSMSHRFRRPGAPRAFLDALVTVNAQALGVLSCQQSPHPRVWNISDSMALKKCSAKVALHLSRMSPSVLDATVCGRPESVD